MRKLCGRIIGLQLSLVGEEAQLKKTLDEADVQDFFQSGFRTRYGRETTLINHGILLGSL